MGFLKELVLCECMLLAVGLLWVGSVVVFIAGCAGLAYVSSLAGDVYFDWTVPCSALVFLCGYGLSVVMCAMGENLFEWFTERCRKLEVVSA